MPPQVFTATHRDAGLRAVKLNHKNDKDLFNAIHQWVQNVQSTYSVGTQLAATLLYARLVRAFERRKDKTVLTETTTSGSKSSSPTSEKGNTPASSTKGGNTGGGRVNIGSTKQQQQRFAIPTNLDLSANVASSLFGVATDLATTHSLLPIYFQDWSVAHVACLALDLFLENAAAAETLYRCTFPNADLSEVSKFRTYLVKSLEWIAGRTVRATEALYDYLYVWDSITMPTTNLELEPLIPGLPSNIDNDDKKDSSSSPPLEERSPSQRLQHLAWKVSCLVALESQTETLQVPSRRQRLLASSAALALISALSSSSLLLLDDKNSVQAKRRKVELPAQQALDRLTEQQQEASSPPQDDDDKGKSNDDDAILKSILGAANEEAAFTRWASLDALKVSHDLSMEELISSVQSLAKTLNDQLQQEFNDKKKKKRPSSTTTALRSNLESEWLVKLSETVSDPKTLIYYLPSLVDGMYGSMMHDLKSKKLRVEAVPYLDEATMIHLTELSTDPFCDKLDRPIEANQDPKLMAVAGTVGAEPSQRPARLEKSISESASEIRRAVTPPVITEGMELNEWAVSILYLEVVKPSESLRALLRSASEGQTETWHEVIVPIINKTLLRLSQENLADKPSRIAPVSVQMEPEAGVVEIHGDMTSDKQLYKAVVALYYHALEAVLVCETARLATETHPSIVLSAVFHRALLACCCMCVIKAIGATQKLHPSSNLQTLQIYSILHIAESNPYDYLKVSESFYRSLSLETARGKLGSPLIFSLPRILLKEVKQTEVQILDSLLWARDPKFDDSMPDKIGDFEEKTYKGKTATLWPPEVLAPVLDEEIEDLGGKEFNKTYPTPQHDDYPEYRCVSYLLRKLLKLAFHRIQALCKVLGIPPQLPVANQVWVGFRYLLRYHIYLLYDRHVDHWILCSLYGVTKTMKYKPDITFARIIDAYVSVRGQELGDVTCQRIVRHIKITGDDNDPGLMGNVIMLYNKVFVPSMKEHLLKSKSLKRKTAEIAEMQATAAANRGTPSPSTEQAQSRKLDPSQAGPGETQTILQFGSAESKAISIANDIVAGGASSGKGDASEGAE